MSSAKAFTLVVILVLAIGHTAPALAGWDEGVAAFTSKKFQAAARQFQAIVKQNPDGWRGHYMLGLSLGMAKRKEEALHHLGKTYGLNPNDLSVKVALGRAYNGSGQHSEAEKVLKEALKPVWHQLGVAYEKQKKYAESIEAYQNAGYSAAAGRVRKASGRRR